MIAATLFEIVGYLISVIVMLVIVQFVMSLLISFNVVNTHNDFVAAIAGTFDPNTLRIASISLASPTGVPVPCGFM